MPKRLVESQTLTVTEAAGGDTPGRLQLGLITPGWGSSGYYSPKVLENAANAKVFAKGTKLFLDHPSETERRDRPERSVRDLAAVLSEDARWDGSGLVAEAKIIGPYKELLTDDTFVENVGMSIAAYAETTIGEAEGRKGTIVTELTEAFSVDFVTFPGRGGAILSVLESARRVDEATASDTREALTAVLREVYGGEDIWIWVRDFDPDQGLVWFTVEDADSMTTYQHGYSLDDNGAAALADGDPVEVRARTEYVPVTTDASEASPQSPVAPAGSTPTHESPKEDTMPQIEESRLAQLEADAGRVQTLESERDAAVTERDQERTARLAAENRAAAVELLAESDHRFTKLERRGLLANLPVAESGELDVEKFNDAIATEAAEAARAGGAGRVTGFGNTLEESGDGPSYDDYQAGFTVGQKGA